MMCRPLPNLLVRQVHAAEYIDELGDIVQVISPPEVAGSRGQLREIRGKQRFFTTTNKLRTLRPYRVDTTTFKD